MSRTLLVLAFVAASMACPFLDSQPEGKDMTDLAKHCPHALKKASSAPDVTVQGCTCKSECGATVDLSGAKCDWCYTENDCGTHGLTGYYDYCVYPAIPSYQNQTWSQKQNHLWSKVTADQTSGTYPNVAGMLAESVQTSFNENNDVMPAGRIKYIHAVGAVCKFTFMNTDTTNAYTGIFTPGQIQHGFVRMGSAAAVTTSSGVIPGLGIKFMRSGVQSGNFVALVALDALPNKSYNFFESNFTNHIPPPTGVLKILSKKFNQASECATQVGLSDMATYDLNGKKTDSPKFPFRVELFAPNNQLPTDPCTLEELQAKLSAIKGGTKLFSVSAYSSPAHYKSGNPPDELGWMYTEEDCVDSSFGDSSLFFQHQRIEDDWALESTWMAQLDPEEDCGVSSLSGNAPESCDKYEGHALHEL